MKLEILPDETYKETFDNNYEYNNRLLELQRTMGKNKLFYHGWLNGQLVIMYR